MGVVGTNCAHIEDVIDQIVVGDGSDNNRFILTSSHPNETLDDAIEFARSLTGEYSGEIQIVEL